jgi:site-specific DNA-methyltransferase (adenine-specific)
VSEVGIHSPVTTAVVFDGDPAASPEATPAGDDVPAAPAPAKRARRPRPPAAEYSLVRPPLPPGPIADVLSGAARWHVHQGEALAFLHALPDASVDGLVADSPYSSGGFTRGDRSADPTSKYEQNSVIRKRLTFSGDTRDQRGYHYWCALWLAECLRVVKPGGPIVLFSDWRQLPVTTDAMQAAGWMWRGIAAWNKGEGTRPQCGRFRAQCEYLVWGSAGPMPLDRDAPVLPGFFSVNITLADKHHLTGKPSLLMREVVQIVERGGVVLDPFCGGGTTGVGALLEGRRFLGCETLEEHALTSRDRCAGAAGEFLAARGAQATLGLLPGTVASAEPAVEPTVEVGA